MVDGEQEKLNNVFVQNTLSNGCAVPQSKQNSLRHWTVLRTISLKILCSWKHVLRFKSYSSFVESCSKREQARLSGLNMLQHGGRGKRACSAVICIEV